MKRPLPFHSNNVWPPVIALILFVIMYGMLVGSLQLIRVFAGIPIAVYEEAGEVRIIEAAFLMIAAGAYGVYRVWRFHPRCNYAYLGWLRLTPWTSDTPLPLGPVHLVWQDAVVIGVLTAIVKWQLHGEPLFPLVAFGSVYLALMTVVLLWTRRRAVCVMLGFLWPALMLPQLSTLACDLLIAAIVVVVWYGHRQSLRAFPWMPRDQPAKPPESILRKEIQPISATGAPLHLGWPLTAIGPKIKAGSISTQTAIWLSALFGWWSYCLLERNGEDMPPEVIIVFAMLAAFIRFGMYCSYAVTPFNIWGRLASGRLIVPGFDKVLLTPLAVILISIAGGIVVHHSGAWYSEVEAVVIALSWFVLFNGGPTRKNWVLTGYVRFQSPRRAAQQRALLRQV